MSSTSVPPLVVGDRFATITDDDHTGVLWVVSILCFIYTIMVFVLRLEARRKNFGLDDVLAIIGTLFASIQYILVFVATSHGLGRSYLLVSQHDAELVGKYAYAAEIFLLLALGLAKCSVISLCRRLFSAHRRSHRIVCDIAMGLCAVWSIASILTVTVNCDTEGTVGYGTGFCHDNITRWKAVGILDAITEIAIVAMAFDGLLPLQMSMSRKLQAIATFILRLIIVVFAALHISTLRTAAMAPNTGVAITKPIIYLQVELLYALLSASIPALNRWLRNFDTSMGSAWMYNSQAYGTSKSEGRSESQSIPLGSVENAEGQNKRASRVSMLSKQNAPKRTSAGIKSGEFVPPGPKYMVSTETYAVSPSPDATTRPESGSMSSDDMIIRKDVQWNVQYENDGSVHRPSKEVE